MSNFSERNNSDELDSQQNCEFRTIISLDPPTNLDYFLNSKLEETLKAYDYFESDEQLDHRINVLTKLNTITQDWIKQMSLSKLISPEMAAKVGGGLRTFGSYRLGVHSKGGDVDALVVAPRHITRSDFFTQFVKFISEKSEVCNLRTVEDAFVPVIKLTFDGIEIDIVFARLGLPSISDDIDLNNDELLNNLDERCVRSLNGFRVVDAILNLVPSRENFKATLRAIKLWAKRHGLYSNVLGFFGGITLAILVARICQLYPNAIASTLVFKFFLVYSRWEWPNRVVLKPIGGSKYGFEVWDPQRKPRHRYDLMPIITPVFPEQNSTHNVTHSTRKIIMEKIREGNEVCKRMSATNPDWSKLFTGHKFFEQYDHYLAIIVSISDEDKYLKCSGFVEAKLRFLVTNLERDPSINIAHISSETYTPINTQEGKSISSRSMSNDNSSAPNSNENLVSAQPEPCTSQRQSNDSVRENAESSLSALEIQKVTTLKEIMWMIGLKFGNVVGEINLTSNWNSFKSLLYSQATQLNLNHENVDIKPQYFHQNELCKVLPKDLLPVVVRSKRKRVNTETKEENNQNENGHAQTINRSVSHTSSEASPDRISETKILKKE